MTKQDSAPVRILIACAGLGMGNASRCCAIAESLEDLGARSGRQVSLQIFTWGAALAFFMEYRKTAEFDFGLVAGSPYRRNVLSSLKAYVRNLILLRKTINKFRPQVIVLDSDYHFPAYFGVGCRRVFVGQAADVIRRAKEQDYRISSLRERINFYAREICDFWIQKIFSHAIIVPSFSEATPLDSRQTYPLIVRRGFLATRRQAPNLDTPSIGVLLSGSGLERESLLVIAKNHGLKVLGRDSSGGLGITDGPSLDAFEVIVCQGGLSSLSECIARGKFVVVLPMRNHPEQQINARTIERLGLGLCVSLEDLTDFPRLLTRIKQVRQSTAAAQIDCSGADKAANLIFNELSTTVEVKNVENLTYKSVVS